MCTIYLYKLSDISYINHLIDNLLVLFSLVQSNQISVCYFNSFLFLVYGIIFRIVSRKRVNSVQNYYDVDLIVDFHGMYLLSLSVSCGRIAVN